jgi:hypothetical protein
MLTLSTRSKEAIKTALAMAIAYGIALQTDVTLMLKCE